MGSSTAKRAIQGSLPNCSSAISPIFPKLFPVWYERLNHAAQIAPKTQNKIPLRITSLLMPLGLSDLFLSRKIPRSRSGLYHQLS